MNEMIWM